MSGEASDFDIAKCMLTVDEGRTFWPIDDSTGKRVFLDEGKLTIGIGHNLESKPLAPEVIDLIFKLDYEMARADCITLYPKFETFPQPRRLAIINMSFNLGLPRLKTFQKMNALVNAGEWLGAAREATHSWWFIQVKARGHRVVTMMQTNLIPKEYRGQI